MKSLLIICFVLCAVAANPVPEKDIDMLRIPLEGDKELDVLTLADNSGKISERNKRTLEILRGLFPSLTEVSKGSMNGIITSTLTFAAPLLLKMVSGTGMGGNQPQESEETNTEYEGMQTFAPAFGDPIVSNNSDNDKIPAGSQNHYITYAPNPIVEETTTKPVEKNPNQSTNILSNGNNGIVHPTPTSSSHVKVDPTHANQIKDPTMNTKVDTNKTGNASTNSNIVVTHPMHVINTTTTKNSNIGVTSRPCPIIQTTIKNDVSNHFSQENFEDTTNTLPTPKPTSKEINQPSQIVTHPVNVINTTTTNNSNIGVTRRPCPLIQTTIKNDVSNHFSHEDNRNSLPTLKPTPIELSQNNQAPLKLICECTDKVNANDAENSLDASAINSELDSIRVVRETIAASENAIEQEQEQVETKQIDDQDQQTAESNSPVVDSPANDSPAIDELSLDNEEVDENRNKRFLNFGFGASSGNSAGGGGGGSGNFLFDIIRSTADRAARAAGTVYRVVAGTETLGINDTGSLRTATIITKQAVNNDGTTNNGDNPLLVSGGSGTEQTDEKANAPADDTATKTDGYTEGIPGPVTRLFVLANRGLSNLIQDLILRVAQTSERVVNFKARLITSLI